MVPNRQEVSNVRVEADRVGSFLGDRDLQLGWWWPILEHIGRRLLRQDQVIDVHCSLVGDCYKDCGSEWRPTDLHQVFIVTWLKNKDWSMASGVIQMHRAIC